jgi:hypothetical protein
MEEQERRKCAAKRSNGEVCRRAPIKGGTVCGTHGGSAPQVKRAAAARVVAAKASAAVERFGLDAAVDPATALLGEVARTSGMALWLGEQLAVMTDAAVATSAEYQAWTAERQHLARVSKAALDAGVDERRVALAEAQAVVLAGVIRTVLDALHLTQEQRATAVTIVRQQLTALSA